MKNMIINEIKQVNFKNKTRDKKILIDNFTNIIDKIDKKQDIILIDNTIEENKKILDFYKQDKQKTNIYTLELKNYNFTIIEIIDNNNIIYFIIREEELNNYFKNYYRDTKQENIKNLNNDKIINKLTNYDFLIYNKDDKYFITLLHLNNDFSINEEENKKIINTLKKTNKK